MAFPRLDHLYGADVFAEAVAPSWWQTTSPPMANDTPRLEGEATCDVAVIGAGYTGLSAALHLARDHGRTVIVVDAGFPGWGASGRNAGFCCLGGAKLGHAAMAARHGIEAARRFDVAMTEAVDLVAELIETHGIDAERAGAGEYELLHRPLRRAAVAAEAAALSRRFACRAEALGPADLAGHGLAAAGVHGAIFIDKGFGLNPLRYARGLADAAIAAGAVVHGGTPVFGWRRDGGRHHLATPRGRIVAESVLLAVNAYHPSGLSPRAEKAVLPALSGLAVTRPLDAGELAAAGWREPALAYDGRNLLHYFRLLPDGRFLFGGRGGLSLERAARERWFRRLRADFERMFPAWRDVPFEHCWRGFVGLAFDLVPHVWRDPADPGISAAHLYHGNGVAMATYAGRALARLAAGAATGLPAFMESPPPVPAFAGLRRHYLSLAYLWYGAIDRGLLPALDLPSVAARFLAR